MLTDSLSFTHKQIFRRFTDLAIALCDIMNQEKNGLRLYKLLLTLFCQESKNNYYFTNSHLSFT